MVPATQRRRSRGLAALMCLGLSLGAMTHAASATAARGARPLTLHDAIESTRFMRDSRRNAVFLSPSGRRYAVVVVRGDVARDGVWWELLIGDLVSPKARPPRSVVRLFTHGKGASYEQHFGSDELTAGMNAPTWQDERRVAFFWEDARGIRQVMSVDVERGRVMPLTRHPTHVVRYGVGPEGSLIYTAAAKLDRSRADARKRDGYVVMDGDVMELLNGSIRGAWDWMFNERFVVQPNGLSRRIAFEGGERVSRYLPIASTPVFSPDGRFAITPHTLAPERVPSTWRNYTLEHFQDMWRERDQDPEAWYARQFETLFVVDVANAHARPLWNAPNEPYGRTRIAWSPRGDRLLLGPTFLPPDETDNDSREGLAVVEVDVATGRYWRLPVPGSMSRDIRSIQWVDARLAQVHFADGRQWALRREYAGWVPQSELADAPLQRSGVGVPAAPLPRVYVREGLNQAPILLSQDEAGKETVLLDPNPTLGSQIRLGYVEWLNEVGLDGSAWEGRLYYPVNYQQGHRYPLVFQTYAFTRREEFSLYGHDGPPLGPGRSVYIAQPLAGRDVFVLHGPSRAESIPKVNAMLDALEAQIERLVAEGKVDGNRIGIMGFSASGWLTTYALTRGKFPYAAAITDDNKDGSYLQAALSGWTYSAGEEMIGAPPFGAGLHRWLEHSPAMNTERIHTPLLMARTSPGGELLGWELFTRLRYQRKPVEYFFGADIEHGSHVLQNPRQLMALQGRALDWWCYWLKGERDPDLRKAEQYARWDELRRRHEHDLQSLNAPVGASR